MLFLKDEGWGDDWGPEFESPVYMSSWTRRGGVYDIMNTDVFTSHKHVYHRQVQAGHECDLLASVTGNAMT